MDKTETPFNRFGYKYAWAVPYTLLPGQKHFAFLTIKQSIGAALSSLDRNPLVNLLDSHTATAQKGWSSVRGTHGVKHGCWYFEVKIIKAGDVNSDAHCRVGKNKIRSQLIKGWTRREAYLDWAVGTDEFGYGYRDASGESFHKGVPTNYGESFKTGDVIGCMIDLGEHIGDSNTNQLISPWPMTKHDNNRVIIKYKGNTFFESKEYSHYDVQSIAKLQDVPLDDADADSTSRSLRTKNIAKQIRAKQDMQSATSYNKQLKSLVHTYPVNKDGTPCIRKSSVQFFKNGVFQGDAFTEISAPIASAFLVLPKRRRPKEAYMPSPPCLDDGTLGYYPTISLFRGGEASVNFSKTLEFPPDTHKTYRLFHERTLERDVESLVADILSAVETNLLHDDVPVELANETSKQHLTEETTE